MKLIRKLGMAALCLTSSIVLAGDKVHEYYMTLDDNLIGAPASLSSLPIIKNNQRFNDFIGTAYNNQLAYLIKNDSSSIPYATFTDNFGNLTARDDFVVDAKSSKYFDSKGLPIGDYYTGLEAYQKASAFEKRRLASSIIKSIKDQSHKDPMMMLAGKEFLLPIKLDSWYDFDFDRGVKKFNVANEYCGKESVISTSGLNNTGLMLELYKGPAKYNESSYRCTVTADFGGDMALAEKVDQVFTDQNIQLFVKMRFSDLGVNGDAFALGTDIVIAEKVIAHAMEDSVRLAVKGRKKEYPGFKYLTTVSDSDFNGFSDVEILVYALDVIIDDKVKEQLSYIKKGFETGQLADGEYIMSQVENVNRSIRLIGDNRIELVANFRVDKDSTGFVAQYNTMEVGGYMVGVLDSLFQYHMTAPRIIVLGRDGAKWHVHWIESLDRFNVHGEGQNATTLNPYNLLGNKDFDKKMKDRIGFDSAKMVKIDDVLLTSKRGLFTAGDLKNGYGSIKKPEFTDALINGSLESSMACNLTDVEKLSFGAFHLSGRVVAKQKLEGDIDANTLMRNIERVVLARYTDKERPFISSNVGGSSVSFSKKRSPYGPIAEPPAKFRVENGMLVAIYDVRKDDNYQWIDSEIEKAKSDMCSVIESL